MSLNHLELIENNNSLTLSESGDSSCSEEIISEIHIANLNSKRRKKKFLDSKYKYGRWTDSEHHQFIRAMLKLGKNNWKKLEEEIPTRSSVQIRSHGQKFLEKLLKKYNILSKTLDFFS